MSKLDETYNFLDLYVHAAGKFKTPKDFHLWSGIALIAACVETRVTIEGFDHAQLYPNMWTFLIGGSGVGKDHAIGFALSFLEQDDPILVIDGKLTVPAMYDLMAKHQKETQRDTAPMFLVSSDLPEQLPPGPESLEFTSRVLSMYGGRPRKFGDHTRTSGDRVVKNPLLNWIAGVVPRWFPKAIHPDVFHSGMAGRALFIHGEKDPQFTHKQKPMLPADYDLVRAHLRMRVQALLHVEGKVRMTRKAERILDAWLYEHSQQKPRNEIEDAVHERKLTLVKKLTAILALADWLGGEIVARGEHVSLAIQLLPTVERGVKKVGEYIYKTQDTLLKEIVETAIRDAGKISRSRLVAHTTGRGIKDVKHLDSILDTLVQQKAIERSREKGASGRWTQYYTWNRGRNLKMIMELYKKDRKDEDDAEAEGDNGSDGGSGDAGDTEESPAGAVLDVPEPGEAGD